MTKHRRCRKKYLHVQWSNISSQERVAASLKSCLIAYTEPTVDLPNDPSGRPSLSRPCALKFPAPGPVLVARGSRGPPSEEEPLLACGKAPSLSKPPLNKVLGFGYPTRVITVLLITVDLCHLSTGPRLVIHSPLLCVINWEAWAGLLKWCTVCGDSPDATPSSTLVLRYPPYTCVPLCLNPILAGFPERETWLPGAQVTPWVSLTGRLCPRKGFRYYVLWTKLALQRVVLKDLLRISVENLMRMRSIYSKMKVKSRDD